MIRLIPQLNGGSPNKVYKNELMHAINGMAIKIEPEEFEKLWKKFDPEDNGCVKSDLILKRLGVQTESDHFNDSSMANLNDLFRSDDESALNVPHANIPGKFLTKGSNPIRFSICRFLLKKSKTLNFFYLIFLSNV